MKAISWKVTPADGVLLDRIVDRALSIFTDANPMNLTMDITACHANGCQLRLADLLSADDFNFTHDVGGISRGINRDTGKLEGFFVPRFALRQS
jgi:hypothetical protein